MFSTKTGATKLLIGTVISLIVLKLTFSWLTGSIGILAQATDSLLDLFAGIISFSAIRFATKPADEQHPYGHGKAEEVGGVLQGILIFVAGGLIIYFSIRQIMEGTSIEMVDGGIVIMLVSILVSFFLSRHLLRVSRATNSVILEANAHNITADIYSTLAVLVGLVMVRFTDIGIIDSIIAIGVAIYILKIAYDTIRKPLSGLLDAKLPPSQEENIKNCLTKHSHEVVSFHKLRTRRAGSQCYVDLHLVLAKDISLDQSHFICDKIESEIQTELAEVSITIHVEPCDNECEQCALICSMRTSST